MKMVDTGMVARPAEAFAWLWRSLLGMALWLGVASSWATPGVVALSAQDHEFHLSPCLLILEDPQGDQSPQALLHRAHGWTPHVSDSWSIGFSGSTW